MGYNKRTIKRVTVKCDHCGAEVTVYGTKAAHHWMDEHEPLCTAEPRGD